ncbi:hypothetical protein Lal_00007581 [Lupinus albus]|uniref:Putative encoded peptide n=1 Tax=Lupinus albus TaxID=3870 RepID=A0A6A5MXE3_LUPAL|nr:putative encoded peptide [Lupinus albus]KAE9596659.1 putative encoded peptide [Lupinus albus]KAF1874965.1 hypothetical protein Lal_00007581 [Lupinus albus]
MAQDNKSFSFLILLALVIFYQGFHSIEGRHLNSDNVHGGVSTTNEDTLTQVSSPTLPSVTDGATTVAPPPPGHNVDDFRPTAPGHSPGVGHSVHN